MVQLSDVIIIAVKPLLVGSVIQEICQSMPASELSKKCFISIAAGISLQTLEGYFPEESNVSMIRVMPNTPCSVGECAAAYSIGTNVKDTHKQICIDIFSSVGIIHEVPEKLMDAVTGLSGSGPACKIMALS